MSTTPTMMLSERRDLFPHAYHREDVELVRLEKWVHAYDNEPGWEIDINPPYQRPHAWTLQQKRAYVEYILRGGEVSRRILFASRGQHNHHDQRWRLLDGKQRLASIVEFVRGEFAVFADEDTPEGYKASQIIDLKRQRYTLEIQVVDIESMADEIRLYLAINSGGTPHSDAELERVRALLDQELSSGKTE